MTDAGAARTELDSARDRFVNAVDTAPDEALGYLKPGDDYSLGGLLIHVNGVLQRYVDILDGIVSAGGSVVDATAMDRRMAEANKRSQDGIDGPARRREETTLRELHSRVATTLAAIPPGRWDAKTPVLYEGSTEPYPTGADNIAGWLTGHYDEHVPHVAELVKAWSETVTAG